MPIIFKNEVNKVEKLPEPKREEVKTISQMIGEREAVAKLPTTDSPDHHVLVVDGKAKLVSKRSQYLIDMMTTEEE